MEENKTTLTDDEISTGVAQEIRGETADADEGDTSDTDSTDSDSDSTDADSDDADS